MAEYHSLYAVNRRSIWDVSALRNGVYENFHAIPQKILGMHLLNMEQAYMDKDFS